MSTTLTTTTCIARYRADSGVLVDASNGVYQWTDLTGNGNHLLQASAINRPVYNGQSIFFNDSSRFLNLPSGLALPGAISFCTRGTGTSIITLGTSPGSTFSYGFVSTALGLTDTATYPFSKQTYLPDLTAIAHAIRLGPGTTRLCVGTTQTSDLAYDLSAFNSSGGSVGQSFTGDFYELALYDTEPSDADLQTLVKNLQAYNDIRTDANRNQIIFIGDSNITTCPTAVCQLNANALKPLVLANASHTIADQQALVASRLTDLDLTPFGQTVAVVCVGSNDAAAGRTTTQIVTDLASLCTSLGSLGMKAIVATIPQSAMSAVNTALRTSYSTFADALVDWDADARLTDITNPIAANDGVKAALLQPAIDSLTALSFPQTALSFASFYQGGRTFTGAFGNFMRT